MAGPLNGVGYGQQQVPLATTFQPGKNNDQVRAQNDSAAQPKENFVQPQGTPAAQGQRAEAPDHNLLRNSLKAELDPSQQSDARRGSVVDITV